jgi:hypothetical protein
MLNIIITFYNRRQRGRARGLSQRGESEKRQRKETEGKRQRGIDRGEQKERKRHRRETEGKRWRGDT